MIKSDFDTLWRTNYSDTAPLAFVLRQRYADRWFRIHSLPAAKRYADSAADWAELLSRQNDSITDMLGTDATVALVTGGYEWSGVGCEVRSEHIKTPLDNHAFTALDAVDLHQLDPSTYDLGDRYKPAFSPIIWQPNAHNTLLMAIADDTITAFFISFEQQIIIAPYDGGIDFIVKDTATQAYYKNKYKQWLSDRADGL